MLGVIVAVPFVVLPLLIDESTKPPVNQQAVVLVEDQVRVVGLPVVTVAGEKESVGVETDPAVTVRFVEALAPPQLIT